MAVLSESSCQGYSDSGTAPSSSLPFDGKRPRWALWSSVFSGPRDCFFRGSLQRTTRPRERGVHDSSPVSDWAGFAPFD